MTESYAPHSSEADTKNSEVNRRRGSEATGRYDDMEEVGNI